MRGFRRRAIGRPCIDCGRPAAGTRCAIHEAEHERRRQARQPYRAVYSSAFYQRERLARIRMAGERCEALVEVALVAAGFGIPAEPYSVELVRCDGVAQEAHHTIPLSTAISYEEALAFCHRRHLRAVCWRHNPRGANAPQPTFPKEG